MRAVVLGAAAIGLLAPAADASVTAGRAWPGGRITYAVTSKALQGPVRVAAQAWNRSGIRVQFVEVPRSRAKVLIRPMRKRSCFGQIGVATVGYTPGFGGRMQLQASCPEGTLTMTAAHELGHVLGLGHEDRRCSLMNSVFVSRCRPQPLAWEWFCSPPRDDDRRGALRLYGGRFRPAGTTFCESKTLPGTVARLGDAADPVDSLGRVRLSFLTPSSTSLRRVIVTRRRGRVCGDTPISQAVPIVQRNGVTPRLGTLVAEIAPAARSSVVSVEDLAVTGNATWCYAVFTLDRRNRWRVAGQRLVTRGPEAPLATRLGFAATPSAPAGVTLQWTNPRTPLAGVQVVRGSGPCPADPQTLSPYASATNVAGAATFTDPVAGTGSWCYGLRFTTVAPGSRPLVATVQIVRA